MATATDRRKPAVQSAERSFAGNPMANAMEEQGAASAHGEGMRLFSEGESPRGVAMLYKGRVRLTMNSADGKTLVLKVAKPGDFLDLGSSLLGKPHEVSAETSEPVELRTLPQKDFLRLMQQDGHLSLQVAQYLSQDFHEACVELTMLGLSRTAESRIASLLLRINGETKPGKDGAVKLTSTHEELSQVVGTSRETVTRVLARLRRSGLIEIHGSKLVLRDAAALRRLANIEEPEARTSVVPMLGTNRPLQLAHAAY
jgi:CRP/FNR family cyclic AMP-dependent transcriptional regulator